MTDFRTSTSNKKIKSAPNRFYYNQTDQQLSDFHDVETHRSLSTCPTYSSLSRHSPETCVSSMKIKIYFTRALKLNTTLLKIARTKCRLTSLYLMFAKTM